MTSAFTSNTAQQYADMLLKDMGFPGLVSGSGADHPAIAWRRSGLLETTGLMLPLPLVSHVDGALLALKSLYPKADLPLCGAVLMGERARLRETIRNGRMCAGGYGYLLDCADGRIALNLVRDDDWDLIPAWLEEYIDDWEGIKRNVLAKTAGYLSERASELGLAVAIDRLPNRPKNWYEIKRFGNIEAKSAPLVIDLSGLWAGPLASSLLTMCGARVIKVEGPDRPDGMRGGHKGFYELLNCGKECVAFNFKNATDLAHLKTLLGQADVVIEASRPRAFAQLGIRAEDYVARKPGMIWARLTAYGRHENRIGFGDDIGISSGLATIMETTYGEACFVGDAIADPVNGVHLAYMTGALLKQGAGAVVDMSMRDVLRYAMGDIPDDLQTRATQWQSRADTDTEAYYPLRKPKGETKPLGADTIKIIAELC